MILNAVLDQIILWSYFASADGTCPSPIEPLVDAVSVEQVLLGAFQLCHIVCVLKVFSANTAHEFILLYDNFIGSDEVKSTGFKRLSFSAEKLLIYSLLFILVSSCVILYATSTLRQDQAWSRDATVAKKVQESSDYIDSRGLKEGLAFFYLSALVSSIWPYGNQTPNSKSQQ